MTGRRRLIDSESFRNIYIFALPKHPSDKKQYTTNPQSSSHCQFCQSQERHFLNHFIGSSSPWGILTFFKRRLLNLSLSLLNPKCYNFSFPEDSLAKTAST
jgi:hypothetical protein